MKVNRDGDWKAYWGTMPLPKGAQALGTVEHRGTGALIRLESGQYVKGNAGGIKSLPQNQVNVE